SSCFASLGARSRRQPSPRKRIEMRSADRRSSSYARTGFNTDVDAFCDYDARQRRFIVRVDLQLGFDAVVAGQLVQLKAQQIPTTLFDSGTHINQLAVVHMINPATSDNGGFRFIR